MSLFYSNNNQSLLKDLHKNNNLKIEVEQFSDQNVIAEFVIEKKKRNDFHLERSPQSGISTMICKICGNDKFIVGQAEFFTAIKCDECGYELGIHEG